MRVGMPFQRDQDDTEWRGNAAQLMTLTVVIIIMVVVLVVFSVVCLVVR